MKVSPSLQRMLLGSAAIQEVLEDGEINNAMEVCTPEVDRVQMPTPIVRYTKDVPQEEYVIMDPLVDILAKVSACMVTVVETLQCARSGWTAMHHCLSPTIPCEDYPACSAHSVNVTAPSLNSISYHRNPSAIPRCRQWPEDGMQLCTRGNTHAQMVVPSMWQ